MGRLYGRELLIWVLIGRASPCWNDSWLTGESENTVTVCLCVRLWLDEEDMSWRRWEETVLVTWMLERQWRREETERITALQEPSLAAVGCRAGIDAPIGFIFVQVEQEKASLMSAHACGQLYRRCITFPQQTSTLQECRWVYDTEKILQLAFLWIHMMRAHLCLFQFQETHRHAAPSAASPLHK